MENFVQPVSYAIEIWDWSAFFLRKSAPMSPQVINIMNIDLLNLYRFYKSIHHWKITFQLSRLMWNTFLLFGVNHINIWDSLKHTIKWIKCVDLKFATLYLSLAMLHIKCNCVLLTIKFFCSATTPCTDQIKVTQKNKAIFGQCINIDPCI